MTQVVANPGIEVVFNQAKTAAEFASEAGNLCEFSLVMLDHPHPSTDGEVPNEASKFGGQNR